MASSTKPPVGPIRLGSKVPNFKADTTQGPINFYDETKGLWAIVFAFPDDFTPVATTELVTFTLLQSEFAKRNVRLFALTTNNTLIREGKFKPHQEWVNDIDEISQEPLKFPIISDEDGSVCRLFNVINDRDVEALQADDTVGEGLAFKSRTVFIIDERKQFRLILNYPAAVGINTAEVLRAVDCLQTAALADVRTPANWIPGADVIVPPKYSNEEAKKKFPGYKTLKPYLRVYGLPEERSNVADIETISEEATENFLRVD
ncbi:Fc.00g104660.m01.CDS01 [Cosmosporella sp. VM-42]